MAPGNKDVYSGHQSVPQPQVVPPKDKKLFFHISETFKASDLKSNLLSLIKAMDIIFDTITPYGMRNKVFYSGHQLVPLPQVAPKYPLKKCVLIIICQRLLKL